MKKQRYNKFIMTRPLTKPRPAQGTHLAKLRKAAGLSQHQLADILSVPQQSIAFWETSIKPPRSEVLPKMAETLGVAIGDLIFKEEKITHSKLHNKPSGKVRAVFEEVANLPRNQQDKVVEFVSAFVNQYHLGKRKSQSQ